MDDIKNLNLYDILGILPSADSNEIKKAYRKKALSCHPDKNPDDPNAVKLFHQLSKTLEILLDQTARAAYDKVLKAREALKLRNQKLDGVRKRLKQQLEEQELKAEQEHGKLSDEEKLQFEIDRLRKQASKEVEKEQQRVRQMLLEQLSEKKCAVCRLRIHWKSDGNDPNNGGYNSDILRNIFSKYGKIENLVLSNKKKGSALIEFDLPQVARKAKLLETGLKSNPLRLKMLGIPEENNSKLQQLDEHILETQRTSSLNTFPCFNSVETISNSSKTHVDLDSFEAEVLQKLKEAQERKKNVIN